MFAIAVISQARPKQPPLLRVPADAAWGLAQEASSGAIN